jgi:hypothetical protein
MEQITTNIKNLTLHQTNYNLLPGTKIKLKDDDTSYIFIGYTNDNKYVLMNNIDKQIYNNTIIFSSIENIIT